MDSDIFQNFVAEHHVDRNDELARFAELKASSANVVVLTIEDSRKEGYGKTWLVSKILYDFLQSLPEGAESKLPIVYIDFSGKQSRDIYQSLIDVILDIQAKLLDFCPFPLLTSAVNKWSIRGNISLASFCEKVTSRLPPGDDVTLGNLVLSASTERDQIRLGDYVGNVGTAAKVSTIAQVLLEKGRLPKFIEVVSKKLGQNEEINWWEGLEYLRPGAMNPLAGNGDGGQIERLDTDFEELSSQIRDLSTYDKPLAYEEITAALLADLGTITKKTGILILAFDGYHRAPEEIKQWIWSESKAEGLLTRLGKERLSKVYVIISGRNTTYIDPDDVQDVREIPMLCPFTEAEVQEYFQKRGVSGLPFISGIPKEVALLADRELINMRQRAVSR